MRPVLRVFVTIGLAGGIAVGPAALPASAAGSGNTTIQTAVEAWYRHNPTCSLPTSCLGAGQKPPSPYAPDTLHIGVAAGQEQDRTYLQLDLTMLPAGTKPVGGQLRLPVATGPQDGTRASETASLQACLVADAFADADGSVAEPPKVDCGAVSTAAVFVPAAGAVPAAFTVDLTDLADAWAKGGQPGSLALLPGKDVAATDSWQVAISARARSGPGVAKITAALSFVALAVNGANPPAVAAPVDSGYAAAPPFSPGTNSDVVASPSVQIQTLTAPAPAPGVARLAPVLVATALPSAAVVPHGFKYPGVFLLPILMIGAATWVARAMTRDLAMSNLKVAVQP